MMTIPGALVLSCRLCRNKLLLAKGPAWSWAMGPAELAQAVQEGTFPPPSATSPDAALRRRRAGQQVKELAGHL